MVGAILAAPAAMACTSTAQLTCLPNIASAADTLSLADGDLHLVQTLDPIGTVLIGKKGIVSTTVLNEHQLSLTVTGAGATRVVILGAKGAVLGSFRIQVAEANEAAEISTVDMPEIATATSTDMVRIRVMRGVVSTVANCRVNGTCEVE